MMSLRKFAFVICLIILSPATFAELNIDAQNYIWTGSIFKVPLEIRDNSGYTRQQWPVTTGVPLPFGTIKKKTQLRLVNKQGNEIPCQFTALSRYSARDNSIKWVLLDFQVDVQANKKTTIYLTNDLPAKLIKIPINATELENKINIATGNMEVSFNKNGPNTWPIIKLDDKIFLEGSIEDRPTLLSGETKYAKHFTGDNWNTHGWEKKVSLKRVDINEARYTGNLRQQNAIELELNGPMRSVVVVRGNYNSKTNEKGTIKNFYNFTTRFHFYKGKNFIKVEHAIENSSTRIPQQNLLFHEAALEHSLSAITGTKTILTGGYKDKNLSQKTTIKRNIPLLKDISIYANKPTLKKIRHKKQTQSGGFVVTSNQSQSNPHGEGIIPRFLSISNKEKSITVVPKAFSLNAPRAIEVNQNKLRVILHADAENNSKDRPKYDLDFGQRTLHDVLYSFQHGKTNLEDTFATAEHFEHPLFAYAPPEWYSDTEAWYFEISRSPAIKTKKSPTDSHWLADSHLTVEIDKKQNYNSGGHHESLNSTWLPFLRSGSLELLEENLTKSLWAISYNPGWAYENNKIDIHKGTTNDHSNLDKKLVAWDKLTGFGPKDFYLWSEQPGNKQPIYEQIKKLKSAKTYLNQYKYLPDIEHYAFFRLFEYYYLTGDQRALEVIYGFVNWAVNFQHKHIFKHEYQPLTNTNMFEHDPDALRRGHYSRIYTWMLYTTLAGFHATNSTLFDEFAKWQIRRILGLLRHRHGQLTSWKPKPSPLLEILPNSVAKKIAQHIDLDFLRSGEENVESDTQSWMEAQGPLALHEAYKTYGDERILDALWAQADYFAHHVLFYPKIGMFNNRTSMPNALVGGKIQGRNMINPQLHDRHIQALPILYHYTGWPELQERMKIIENIRRNIHWTSDRFLQTTEWQNINKAKQSTSPPDRITDLKVESVSRSGVTLSWTSPRDDSLSGRASRYFVKYSDKPIIDFAPNDNPARRKALNDAIYTTEAIVLEHSKGSKKLRVPRMNPNKFDKEAESTQRWHENWGKAVAFWMAEHVDGETTPSKAGTKEIVTIKTLKPHAWFGLTEQPIIRDLPPGKYYFAICSLDEDNNLSTVSNLVNINLN